nr:hypothetical protein [candidate division Zixibacteria bacterium]
MTKKNDADGAVSQRSLIASALRVTGAVVEVSLEIFGQMMARLDEPLVIVSRCGWMKSDFRYLTCYKGFILCTRTREVLLFPDNVEVIKADKICLKI